MNILIVGLEESRWGPARLPRYLHAEGCRVAALCPASHPVAHTKYIARHFEMPSTKRAFRLVEALRVAMASFRPELIVPADEMVVALLHYLLRHPNWVTGGRWPTGAREIIEKSLCPPETRDAMLMKDATQQLARDIGVRIPAGGLAATAEEAVDIADRLAYPVLLKKSFSWGGEGVRICGDRREVAAAFRRMTPVGGAAREWARRVLGRDWFPKPSALWVQEMIVGEPAMYTIVAHEGRMLSGFAGLPRSTSTTTGPSTVVDFGPHAEMAAASAKMTAALGATGFISFDFMIERCTGRPYLLECNPRPNQVSHLGPRVGVDLCAALVASLRGAANAAEMEEPDALETITLFPQEWLRAPDSPALSDYYHDVPWDDATLVARQTAATQSAPKARRPSPAPAPAAEPILAGWLERFAPARG